MTKNYLLEIGLEEMPAHVVTPSIKQLVQKVTKFLKEQGLTFKNIKPFSTPRRLALLVEGLSEQQDDVDLVQKGPAQKIAQDQEGNWSKAAIGFANSQQMTVDDIYFEDLKGTSYAYIHVQKKGKTAQEILPELAGVIKSLTFKTRMRWASNDFEYIRPIHWLVSLLDDVVVPFSVVDVQAGRQTKGHRFLGDPVVLARADDYEEALKNEFVIADAADRKAIITSQIKELAAANSWQVNLDQSLLEEVTNLVEYPTSFAGSFDAQYLAIPEEVLITSMKDNQRYFDVRDQDGKLSNHFIAVRNGNRDHLDNVIMGNEKVLVARLDDAKFFYEEDQKFPISHYVDRLNNVSFHDKIGSMAEKMQRVQKIGQIIAQQFALSEQSMVDFNRASEIYKFDLVTGMVGEFAELQGIMGQHYAKLAGERDAVSLAIKEHYQPITAESKLPSSKVGALLALSDKLDTIITFFSAGMIPTSSNDPYALRRYAYGIVRILLKQKWALDFQTALPELIAGLDGLTPAPLPKSGAETAQIASFIRDRVKQYLQVADYRYDVIDAVLASIQQDPLKINQAAQVLEQHHDDQQFKPVVEALTRINNILKKVKPAGNKVVDDTLFENDSEVELANATAVLMEQTDFEQLYEEFVDVRPIIESYFNDNMIMADDDAVRMNRLTQLSILNRLSHQLGDLSQLVIK
ncbi:glycyl-tRNA synthetase beta subunit [Amylolactobacillus amylotrophicus DSM 20534]|uniref:Glycine--tRNA ligase subunit beta n=3 Tax=Amylolactobacillus TaxID=2767876 RepID=A0A1L6XA23_9LACO|nr:MULTISPECIES: glycine--tRNA ligase subunit beta [Amylolactobacillus]APT17819.1 glycine--tRNA ligase subunit beta [Amylolactobacillus amylophilus DSM 20533 = JCM 1125]APT19239.1 glycine--tRNA ligase subunit beta [Amylolactobacillus amylophilus DSM 20533 = JCM 1125]KRK38483.1 glycyl-tRNA synthetase beta subunit [Amylolactobacillus amylotrophicus DSM 20534]KRM42874.1 glycyl-tRNA synthetase beta subunit [Amylolactobacillus amylophilus DSM 20533 = JCM 1125]GED79738.1 glycine--tRNA ligase beta su